MTAGLVTESRGCRCGSVFVGSAPRADLEDLWRALGAWKKLHPEERTFNGAWHDRATVAEARAIQRGTGADVARSRIEFKK